MGDVRFFVKQYISAGWAVVPLDPGSKGLKDEGWLKKASAKGYHLEDFREDSNVGVIPGPPSGNRVSFDLDSDMAVRVGPRILPATGLIHGRAGKPHSHPWYIAPPELKPYKWIDPVTNSMLLELQVGNGQTVMPPSTHPSGEQYEWETEQGIEGEPTSMTMERFTAAGNAVAITAMLATYWPRKAGSRHDLVLCTVGFLGQHFKPNVLTALMEIVFQEAGDDEIKDRMTAVRTTLTSLAAETKPTTGEPTFREKFPHGDAIADAFLKWLGVGRAKGKGRRKAPPATGIYKKEDFVAFLPDHTYMLRTNFEVWAPAAIQQHVESPDKDLTICEWLDRESHVEEVTWSPGDPEELKDTLVVESGVVPKEGMTTLNLYRPPHAFADGDPDQAGPWIDHWVRTYPTDYHHCIGFLAWRVQRPGVKINHGLVLGGAPGIGKDTIFVPVLDAVGPWNAKEVSPEMIMGRFNGYLKATLLRINEARDLGDANRYQLYERTKWILASPPEFFRIDEKNMREHPVRNVVGVIFTTNHKEGGIYLPDNDRRHYVAWSDAVMGDFEDGYFQKLYEWYDNGGRAHVVAYLKQPHLLDGFDPKAPPPRTEAWHQIVAANRSPEEAEIADVLDKLDAPVAVTINDLVEQCLTGDDQSLVALGEWLKDRRNARSVPHRLESLGYSAVRNAGDKQGLWTINGRKQAIFVRQDVTGADRLSRAKDRKAGVFVRTARTERTDQSSATGKIPF